MTIEHKLITDPNIHEPKGAATAPNKTVYVATGTGSGTWGKITKDSLYSGAATVGQLMSADGAGGVTFISTPHGRVSFTNLATPYTVTYPSAYTKVSPTTSSSGSATEILEGTGASLTFNGNQSQHFQILASVSASQSTGANRDFQFAIYKNGTILADSEIVVTLVSGKKERITLQTDTTLSSTDYIELFVKNAGASGDLSVNTFYLFAKGMHEV